MWEASKGKIAHKGAQEEVICWSMQAQPMLDQSFGHNETLTRLRDRST